MDEHQDAHRYFSAECFNRAWELIDQTERTPEEDETMLQLAYASLWHWSQRPECTDRQRSVGYWQLARIYALLGQAEPARRYARLSLEAARRGELKPFFWGYAWEALARAETVAGNRAEADHSLKQALACAQQVEREEDRRLLLADLERLSEPGTPASPDASA
jgi:hypothetical protein